MQETLRRMSQRALSDAWTVSQTYWQTRFVLDHGIEGDLVECGVFAGVQCGAMAQACIDAGQRRTIHLFDSFEGIPRAGANDQDIRELVGSGDIRESSGVSVCSERAVRQHFTEWGLPEEMFVFHPGWFHDTIPVADIGKIALLRLDGDLYESTMVCLEHFYPKLARGGVCIVDDYALDGCRKAVTEYFAPGHPGPVYWCKN